MLYIIRDPLFLNIELSFKEGIKRINSYKKLYSVGIIYIYLSFKVSFLLIYKKNAKFCLINLL